MKKNFIKLDYIFASGLRLDPTLCVGKRQIFVHQCLPSEDVCMCVFLCMLGWSHLAFLNL